MKTGEKWPSSSTHPAAMTAGTADLNLTDLPSDLASAPWLWWRDQNAHRTRLGLL